MKERLRVLFISGELIAADLAYKLKKEGCDVRLYIEDKRWKDCFDGMVKKTNDWKKELKWIGKDGLIVFDDVGYGKIQDDLRKKGYLVVGGSELGDKLEQDREYGQKIFSDYGIKITPSFSFHKIKEAIDFIKKNKGKWVIKQKNHNNFLNYVGKCESGEDTIEVLKDYKKFESKIKNIQKKINGVEIGVARYFNGKDWASPIEFNIEHKGLFNDDIGPKTGEMGTLMWYSEDENNALFKETLGRIKPFLIKANFKGNMDINCVINDSGVFPIEATARFGCPAIHLQKNIHISLWKDFLMAIAKGEKYDLKYNKGYGIIVSLCIPPFPYKLINNDYYLKGAKIILEKLSPEERNRIHFEEVSLIDDNYCIAGNDGSIAYVSGLGNSIEEARKNAYDLINKIIIPKMFYRTDIGLKFMEEDYKKLKKWGWV